MRRAVILDAAAEIRGTPDSGLRFETTQETTPPWPAYRDPSSSLDPRLLKMTGAWCAAFATPQTARFCELRVESVVT
jgi:hypothetical protein